MTSLGKYSRLHLGNSVNLETEKCPDFITDILVPNLHSLLYLYLLKAILQRKLRVYNNILNREKFMQIFAFLAILKVSRHTFSFSEPYLNEIPKSHYSKINSVVCK